MNHHGHSIAGAARHLLDYPCSPEVLTQGIPKFSQAQIQSQAEAQQPQLSRTSERLHHCIAELNGLVSKLESALDPVLNPDMTNTGSAGGAAAPEPVRCPLARSMDARSDEVCEISARVRSLLDRLAC